MGHGKVEHLNNATVLVSPNHPIIKGLLDNILTLQCPINRSKLKCIQQTTGPESFSNYLLKYKDQVRILDNSIFEPCNGFDNHCELPQQAILDHRHEGSWLPEYKRVGQAYFDVKNFLKNSWVIILLILLVGILIWRANPSQSS